MPRNRKRPTQSFKPMLIQGGKSDAVPHRDGPREVIDAVKKQYFEVRPEGPFDQVLFDTIFDRIYAEHYKEAPIPYVAVRAEDDSIIEPEQRLYTPNGLGREAHPAGATRPVTPNTLIYAQSADMTRRALWNIRCTQAIDQAKAWCTYGQ